MELCQTPLFSELDAVHCAVLSEIVGSVADAAVACLDIDGARQVVTSGAACGEPEVPISLERDPGQLMSVVRVTPGAMEVMSLKALVQDDSTWSAEAEWVVYDCSFSNGIVDRVAVVSRDGVITVRDFLVKFWLGVRRMCISEAVDQLGDRSDDAMLWMISRRMNASVLVLDSHCRVLKANTAGCEMLAQKTLLRDTPQGLVPTHADDANALRDALSRILSDTETGNTEYVILLRASGQGARVPMTLSLYRSEEGASPLIIAMLPRPPEQKRIEELVKKMGLTPSEARVAALIRAGLSNREAAKIAGLKVETFNTYAKRVLSKMNVSCRAEMAQMLTWQASMERSL